jgi:hypothetical protein
MTEITSQYSRNGMGMRVTRDREQGITMVGDWFYSTKPNMRLDGGYHADARGYTWTEVRQHLIDEQGFTEEEAEEWRQEMEAASHAPVPPYPIGALIREIDTDWVGAIMGQGPKPGTWMVADPAFPDEEQPISERVLEGDWTEVA